MTCPGQITIEPLLDGRVRLTLDMAPISIVVPGPNHHRAGLDGPVSQTFENRLREALAEILATSVIVI